MTRTSFWKRGGFTIALFGAATVVILWRTTVTVDTPAFDFDLLSFITGWLVGILLVILWGGPMIVGLNAFLDWLDR